MSNEIRSIHDSPPPELADLRRAIIEAKAEPMDYWTTLIVGAAEKSYCRHVREHREGTIIEPPTLIDVSTTILLNHLTACDTCQQSGTRHCANIDTILAAVQHDQRALKGQ